MFWAVFTIHLFVCLGSTTRALGTNRRNVIGADAQIIFRKIECGHCVGENLSLTGHDIEIACSIIGLAEPARSHPERDTEIEEVQLNLVVRTQRLAIVTSSTMTSRHSFVD